MSWTFWTYWMIGAFAFRILTFSRQNSKNIARVSVDWLFINIVSVLGLKLNGSLQIVPHCLCTSQVRHTVRIINLAISFWLLSQVSSFLRKPQCNVLKWELMHTTDQWSGIFRYSSTPNLTQVSCWYLEAMACVRSGSNTELSAITCLIWSSVIKTIPVAILHFQQTVTALLINSWLDISTAPRSLLEETVIPISLLLFTVIHLTELCTEIVATPNPSSRKSCRWLGQLYVVSTTRKRRKNLRSTWYPIMIISQSKTFAIPGRTRSYHEVEISPLGLQCHK